MAINIDMSKVDKKIIRLFWFGWLSWFDLFYWFSLIRYTYGMECK